MKKYFQNITSWFSKLKLINKALIIGAIVYLIAKIVKSIKEKIDRDAAKKQTDEDAANPLLNNPQNSETERRQLCSTVADNVAKEIEKSKSFPWVYSQSEIMTQIELLQNAKEVVYTSIFYKNMYKESLKALLVKKLDGKYNPFGLLTGCRYNDFSSLIKDNLS